MNERIVQLLPDQQQMERQILNRDTITVTQLQQELQKRISQYHSSPTIMVFDDVTELARQYPTCLLLETSRRVSHIIQKESRLTLDKIKKAFLTIAEKQLREAKQGGRYSQFSGSVDVVVNPKPPVKDKVVKRDARKVGFIAETQSKCFESVGHLLGEATLYPNEAIKLQGLPSTTLTELLEKTKVWTQDQLEGRPVDLQEAVDYLLFISAEAHGFGVEEVVQR